jgi:hypothetical protein
VREEPVSAQVQRLVWGALASQVTIALARLGVADVLAGGPRDYAGVAEQVDADPQALLRLLRAAASLGLLTETGRDRYRLTELGECLRDDAPDSARARVLAFGTPARWRLLGELERAVRTGRSTAEAVLGGTIWDHYREHPEESEEFSRAMGEVATSTAAQIAAEMAGPLRGTVVDVGGAYGGLLTGLLEQKPECTGVLFDQPSVIDSARARIDRSPLAGRIRLVGGDFFREVPRGDVYVLMRILHDWDDADAVRILRTCRAGAASAARLAVVEVLVPDPWQPSPAHLFDLAMLVFQGGRERTEAEYDALLAAAGWRLESSVPAASAFSLLQATAV